MAKQTINIGASPNDGTGTPLRTAFDYTNQNFTELYTATGPSGNNIVVPGNATITGDLTVATNRLIVNSVGVSTGGSPAGNFGFSTFGKTGGFYANKNAANQYLAFQMKNSTQDYAMFIDQDGIGSNSWSIFDNTNAHTAMRYYPGVGGSWIHYINGSTAMTLNSTGLGVGVSPATSSKIHTLGNGNNVYAIFQNGDTLATNKTSQLWLSNGPTFLGANNREYRIVNIGTSATAADLVFDYWTGTAIAERMRIDSTGNVGIGVTPSAGKGCLQLSSGINFPATQVASSDANTLDDYEEGTWTGTLGGSTAAPTTPVTATGKYTKIGRQVSIQIAFLAVDTTGASSRILVTGLPFAASSSPNGITGSVLIDAMATFTGSPGVYLTSSSTQIDLYSSVSNGAIASVTHNAGAAKSLWLNVTYSV